METFQTLAMGGHLGSPDTRLCSTLRRAEPNATRQARLEAGA
jgi:hypothetical protein